MSAPAKGSFVPSGQRPPRVLLIVQALRCAQVRRQVLSVMPTAQVDALDDVIDAVLLCARRPADLVLIDHAVAGASAPAVVSNLARVAPNCQVLAFDEAGEDGDSRPGHLRVWDELPQALRAWLSGFETRDEDGRAR